MEELRTQHGLYTSTSRGSDDKQPGGPLPMILVLITFELVQQCILIIVIIIIIYANV